jgi:signal transduction histidine kinase
MRPRAAEAGPAQLPWTLLLAALAALTLGADLLAPNQLGAAALMVIPVLVASWTLGTRALVAVLAVVLVVEVVGMVLGRLEPLAVGGRLVTVAVVTAMGRSAVFSFADVRRARAREVDVLRSSSHLLGRSFDQRRVADEAVRLTSGTLVTDGRGPIRAAILVRVAGDVATVLAADGEASARMDPERPLTPTRLPAAALQVLDDGRPRVVPVADLLSRVGEAPAPGGIVAWAVARVEVGGDAFGLLAAASADLSGFRGDDLRLLDGIARVSGLAIGAALRHTELAEAKARLQQSVELALEVGRSLEPGQVMDSVLMRLAENLEADQATLVRVDGQELVIEATYRPGAGRGTPTHRQFPHGLVERVPNLARALATGEPVVGGRLDAAPGGEELVQALPTGIHTLVLPYAVDGQVVCVFALSRDEGRPFEHADLVHLEPMTDVAVMALRNAIQRATAERAERAASRHSGLVQAIEAAEEIGSAEQLQDAVERARLLAVSVLRADRGNISRLEGDELVVEHDHRPILPYPRRRPLARSRMAAEAIRTRRPVHGRVAQGSVGPDGIAWMVPAGLAYAIQCPMIVGGEVVGVLGLGRSRDQPFTDADGEALLPFAKLVGLLLRNARRLAEARRTGQARSQFMTLAAHELRAPLTVIRGYLSMLEDGTYPVPDRTRNEAVETLVSKAQELESLVELLVMASRLEDRNLPRAAVELDMTDEVSEAVERMRPRARLEGARLSTRVLGRRHAATADPAHVALILNNLLNNALTYSSTPADVTVEVRGGDAVEVAVLDRGHGIPRDQHERVFERFHRVDVGAARSAAGLGLGLTISRELAYLNGGELVLERSAPGQGSVFVLRLQRVVSELTASIASVSLENRPDAIELDRP